MNTTNNLLTPEQVAEILQIHVLTVYGYIRKGKLDAIRLGRSYRIVPHDLQLFIEANRIAKSATKPRQSLKAKVNQMKER